MALPSRFVAIAAPARGVAWWLAGWLALALPGCSLLPMGPAAASVDADADSPAPGAQPAFALEVRAPHEVADYLTRHLELQRFQSLPGLTANELSRLLAAADADARELLATLGYFSPTLAIALGEAPASSTAAQAVTVAVEPGPQTQIRRVQIDFRGALAEAADTAGVAADARPAEADAARRPIAGPANSAASAPAANQAVQLRQEWSLPAGQPFTQAAWDAAKAQGLRALQSQRYPAAQIAHSRAEVDADTHLADLAVTYDPGPAYRFGPLRVQGSQRYDSDGARRLARLPAGAEYSQAQLLDAQQRLASSGYYDAVFLTLDTEASDPQAAAVLAQVREAPLQKWVFGLGLSTDSGVRWSTDHIHNRLPLLGWRAVSKLALDRKTKLIGSEWTDLPDDGGWRWFGGAQMQRETTGSYQVNSARLRAGRGQSTERFDRNYYLQYDYAHSQGLQAPPSSTALSMNYSWTGRYFDHPSAPSSGHGLAWELGAGTTLRPQRDPFVRATVRWLGFVPLGKVALEGAAPRGSRLALRAEGGLVLARDEIQVPVTQLFLTGGDTTVRGYAYREIGARTDNQQLFGGRYLAVVSAEWQRPIALRGNTTDWESTVFTDVGAVSDQPGALRPRVGVGAGLRWRSPVGPLQADLAYGVQAKRLRLHLRLGFTF